ncbi:MAG: Rrf2 family transcriptional regulator [Gammaproteobacteria bacterium]|jgi:Rrf2 family iron-sulfur cluster assembly transcriptional regulator|nr:Rrf2 family transcriptional regulator [Gammaproteobacteria bacterium]HUV23069.1 Rrf2 family transcriptional regulator [Gammaproteobacteria bacterium]
MRLSTKSRYAVTSLLDLVMHSDQGPVSLADISVRQGISLSYLEQLFAKMRRNKLVVSTRGPGGGYSLGSSPDQVCIADVINAVDEVMQIADKDVNNGPVDYEPCLTEQLWEELSAEIELYLTTISLADMMQNDEVRELSRVHDLRQNHSGLQ